MQLSLVAWPSVSSAHVQTKFRVFNRHLSLRCHVVHLLSETHIWIFGTQWNRAFKISLHKT